MNYPVEMTLEEIQSFEQDMKDMSEKNPMEWVEKMEDDPSINADMIDEKNTLPWREDEY